MKLSVVTGMVDPVRTVGFWGGWRKGGQLPMDVHVVVNGADPALGSTRELLELVNPGTISFVPEVLGTVESFRRGMKQLNPLPETRTRIVALLHDDVRIDDVDWVGKVLEHFLDHPLCVLVGFGGAAGVGVEGMYERAFDPMTLVRHDFMSNMVHAEAHGSRVTEARKVAVLDGFSLIGRRYFLEGVLDLLSKRGVVHHAYDVAFGVEARRRGFETWLLPIACHHHGGLTAVGSSKYASWAVEKHGGDAKVWEHAHREVWEMGRGILPFRVEE